MNCVWVLRKAKGHNFGRMLVEAMCNGIPSIVSNRGGLPETTKNSGIIIKNIFDINEWVDSIERLEDENLYGKLSEISKKRAEIFDLKHQHDKFRKILTKMIE